MTSDYIWPVLYGIGGFLLILFIAMSEGGRKEWHRFYCTTASLIVGGTVLLFVYWALASLQLNYS